MTVKLKIHKLSDIFLTPPAMGFTPKMGTVTDLIRKMKLTPPPHPLSFLFAGNVWTDKWEGGGEAWAGDRKEFFPFLMGCLFLLEGDGIAQWDPLKEGLLKQ